MPLALAGAAAVVTGADGDIGYAVCERLLQAGVNVVAHVNDAAHVHRLSAIGVKAVTTGSPADEQTAPQTVERAESVLGPVHLLVTCHARPAVGSFLKLKTAEFWSHVDESLTGTALFLQAAARSMRRAGWGRVVLTTSAWSGGGHGLSAVATAAGGVNVLCKTAARELGPHNISVNVVASAFVDGEWSVCDASALARGKRSSRRPAASPATAGTPSNVAECVRMLCEPRIGAAVAQTIHCSGGYFRNRV